MRRALRSPIACLALAFWMLPAAAHLLLPAAAHLLLPAVALLLVPAAAHLLLPAVALLLVPAVAHATGDLVLIPDLRMMLTLMVLFLLLIAPAHQLIFKPLLRVLDERAERTQGTRARAARIEEEAREVLARYEREIEKTREDAERQRRATLEQVRGESQQLTGSARGAAEQSQAHARRELASALDGARGVLRERAQELAREAAARVLGRPL